jgi:polyferredoxin
MEQLDTELEYSGKKALPDTGKRLNWLYFLPILGLLMIVFLTFAVIFQFSIDTIVNSIMSLFIVLFFVFVGLMFWAARPATTRQ